MIGLSRLHELFLVVLALSRRGSCAIRGLKPRRARNIRNPRFYLFAWFFLWWHDIFGNIHIFVFLIILCLVLLEQTLHSVRVVILYMNVCSGHCRRRWVLVRYYLLLACHLVRVRLKGEDGWLIVRRISCSARLILVYVTLILIDKLLPLLIRSLCSQLRWIDAKLRPIHVLVVEWLQDRVLILRSPLQVRGRDDLPRLLLVDQGRIRNLPLLHLSWIRCLSFMLVKLAVSFSFLGGCALRHFARLEDALGLSTCHFLLHNLDLLDMHVHRLLLLERDSLLDGRWHFLVLLRHYHREYDDFLLFISWNLRDGVYLLFRLRWWTAALINDLHVIVLSLRHRTLLLLFLQVVIFWQLVVFMRHSFLLQNDRSRRRWSDTVTLIWLLLDSCQCFSRNSNVLVKGTLRRPCSISAVVIIVNWEHLLAVLGWLAGIAVLKWEVLFGWICWRSLLVVIWHFLSSVSLCVWIDCILMNK